MTLKQLAAEIYALPYHLRVKRLADIPVPNRGIVRAYMDNTAKRDQVENSRRNAEKSGFSLPRKESTQ